MSKQISIFLFMTIFLSLSGFTFAQQPPDVSQKIQNSVDLQVISKPKSRYTDIAGRKKLQGTVKLKVDFLANGEIGEIIDITKKKRKKFLKYGLTAQAIDAAQKIKFIPAKENGLPITVTKTVEYIFTIY